MAMAYIICCIVALDTEEITEHDLEGPTSEKGKSENKLTVKMEEHAVFEASNKNNVIENQLKVEASEINTVGGNPVPSGAGLPGMPGLGGYVNIALGENAACNLNNMAKLDIKKEEEPEYFILNFVAQSKRRPGHWTKKRHREAFINEFGIYIFLRLLHIYEHQLVKRDSKVKIKPEEKRERTLEQEEWNRKICDKMEVDIFEELNNLVAELGDKLSADEQNTEILEVTNNNKIEELPLDELKIAKSIIINVREKREEQTAKKNTTSEVPKKGVKKIKISHGIWR
ncbi:hypothetical protein LOTGIDRAFT_238421 [Lottia gigantea]|uniref:Uncharacterized protein n=1 Tax=Lottia gigantea TaxID=225164 RepID=V4CFX6_LOTGI|nr:hypothetical protein LOTGIDRAFT_238421 [Lottia gigantea]ESP00945.1 hypothetical protein LOTGIDRAFT_238421 [Lottia gigantea]